MDWIDDDVPAFWASLDDALGDEATLYSRRCHSGIVQLLARDFEGQTGSANLTDFPKMRAYVSYNELLARQVGIYAERVSATVVRLAYFEGEL